MNGGPERPIERLLRACAKKRRNEAGAPPELHPATRRLLQGEVARRYARNRREPRSWPELLAALWRRLVWVFAIFAGVLVIAAMLLPALSKSKSKTILANNRRLLDAKPANEPTLAPPTAPVAPPTVAPAPGASPAGVAPPSDHSVVASSGALQAERMKEPLGLGVERMETQQGTSLTFSTTTASDKLQAATAAPMEAPAQFAYKSLTPSAMPAGPPTAAPA